jgi:hypothetical protein
MSGGSYDYEYQRIDETYIGRMYDDELDDMMKDLVELLHDLEWWKSCDTSEESYRKSVIKFKNKWFGKRDVNLRERILRRLDEAKKIIEKEG